MSIREVVEGLQIQGEDETIVYSLSTTNVGGSPSSVSVVVKKESDNSNVTATVMPSGSHSVASDVITLKPLTALTVGEVYRVEVAFTSAGNNLEHYFRVKCET